MMFNPIYYLLVLLTSIIVGMGHAHASLTLTPITPGLVTNAATGGYLNNQAGALQQLFDTATKTYGPGVSTANVAGRNLSIATKLSLAADAAAIVKTAIKLNPYKIAGTLAAGWLVDKGLSWLEAQQQWVKPGAASTNPSDIGWDQAQFFNTVQSCPNATAYGAGNYLYVVGTDTYRLSVVSTSDVAPSGFTYIGNCAPLYIHTQNTDQLKTKTTPTGTPVPMTDADWDALSDPTPTVGGELPKAPYMPQGAPVGTAQFSPGDVSLGSPYKKSDGSTAEPRGTITDNKDGTITIDTYEKPITNPDGTPVPAGTPNTPTNAPPQTDCDKHSTSVGCTDLGTPAPGEDMPKTTKPIVFTVPADNSNATCPAPISTVAFGKTFTIDYAPACQYASGLKPIVITIAYLSALFIIFGVPKPT